LNSNQTCQSIKINDTPLKFKLENIQKMLKSNEEILKKNPLIIYDETNHLKMEFQKIFEDNLQDKEHLKIESHLEGFKSKHTIYIESIESNLIVDKDDPIIKEYVDEKTN